MSLAWVQPLGWTVLHSLWQGAVLALSYRAVEPLLRTRPRLRHGLGLALLLGAVATGGATWSLQRSLALPDEGAASTASVVRATRPASTGVLRIEAPSSTIADRVAASLESSSRPVALFWLVGAAFALIRLASGRWRGGRPGDAPGDSRTAPP